MNIGDRIRGLREAKHLSQGSVEKQTGLLRCYISRVENGHTVPAIQTLEKLARALELPLYQLLFNVEATSPVLGANFSEPKGSGSRKLSSKDERYFRRLLRLLPRISPPDRLLLLYMLEKRITLRRSRKNE
jgi:transcriptional regulator with XRE-family HTH domain